ncbi:hypothetical protein JCM1840_006166 [Sporobolomyces johnsonii]
MGLVDYGSDSDSDSGSAPPPPAASKPAVAASSSSSSSFLSLPPPKSTSALKLPPPSSSSKPSPAPAPAPAPAKKKDKAPLRIVLDLPSASSTSTDDQEPAKKRPKLALGSGNGGGLTGLAAMLPKPKNEVKPVAPVAKAPAASVGAETGGAGLGDMFGGEAEVKSSPGPAMFVPPSVKGKGKGKDKVTAPAAPPKPVEEPAVDFFGIGSVTSSSSASTSSSSTAKSSLTISSAPSISSAPPTSAPPSSSASNPFGTPTASDPYPGFTQLPSGEWVAKDAKTYEMWMAWSASQQAQPAGGDVPKGFEAREIEEKGMVEVDEAQRAREAWATRPSTVPGKDAEGYKKSSAIKGIPKQASQAARRKGQLSSLIASAHDNRAELEERIAQARANRKSAGNKYGF